VKLKLNHRLKSGALQLTVFIAVLIALLLSGLILYAYTFGYMKEQSKGAIENMRLADTGIDYLLKQQEISIDTLAIDFIKKEHQSVKVHLSQWGIFEKAYTLCQFRKKKFVKIAIIGSLVNSETSATLFLQDTQNPLSLVGNTKINGIAYLPVQGVKTGYIAGQSYYGSQLIYGTIKSSTPSLPQLDKNLLETLLYYLKTYKPPSQQDYITIEANNKTHYSFKEKTKSAYSQEPIILENIEITGNIIIKSDTLIKIRKTALLKDLILIAPIIEIEEGTTGNFQVIASSRITVGKNCELSYPSALVLFQDNKDNRPTISSDKLDNQIYIDSGTTIKGSVCYFQTKELTDFSTQVILESEARVRGQVYCNGNFELRGTVSGSVTTKQFVANQSGSIFVNHIYNGTIENETIARVFGGLLLENEPKTIMKWLY
jgi:cytoskeletal protein CcmA (bactofilin family)